MNMTSSCVSSLMAQCRSSTRIMSSNCVQRLKNLRGSSLRSVGAKINKVTDMMQASPLLDDEKFVKLVLAKSVPKKLQDHMGVDGVYARVPRAYVKAMVASYFASQYVYKFGLSGNEVDVLDFVQEFPPLVS